MNSSSENENEKDRISIEKYFDLKIKDLEKVFNERIYAIKSATDKAETVLNLRLETMNEFRNQLNSERAQYVTRNTLDILLEGLRNEIKTERNVRIEQGIGARGNFILAIGVIVSGVLSAISLLIAILLH
jgi:predicted nucleotide-binding protein (sugar kinase/HSP70/actin superfamily)